MLTYTNAGADAFRQEVEKFTKHQRDGSKLADQITASTLNGFGHQVLAKAGLAGNVFDRKKVGKFKYLPEINKVMKSRLGFVVDDAPRAKAIFDCVELTKELGFPADPAKTHIDSSVIERLGQRPIQCLQDLLEKAELPNADLRGTWLPTWREVLTSTEKYYTYADMKFRYFWGLESGRGPVANAARVRDASGCC
jgi:hypothetical protein